MDMHDLNVERGSGNVFADLDFSEPDLHLLKAELVVRIDDILCERGITRTETARLLGLTRLEVSGMLRGDFRAYSLERLLRFVKVLDHDIDIVIRPSRSAAGGELRVRTIRSG